MRISIQGKETVGEVKEQFQQRYPMLKLEFFHHEHKRGEGSPLSDKIADSVKLSEVGTLQSEGSLDFTSDIVIGDLEALFHENFGLNVQVFRKSGNVWLEIISTDNRTLREENEWALEMSRPVND